MLRRRPDKCPMQTATDIAVAPCRFASSHQQTWNEEPGRDASVVAAKRKLAGSEHRDPASLFVFIAA